MALLRHTQTNREDGFTLIELLVVILIIGILSAIAIPAFLNQRKEASIASLKSDLRNTSTAMETELIKKNSYPTVIPSNVKTSDGVKLSLFSKSSPIDPLVAEGWITVPLTSDVAGEAPTHFYVKAESYFFKIRMTGPWVAVNNTPFYFGYEMTCSDGTTKKGSVNFYSLIKKATTVDNSVVNCPVSSTTTSIKITPHPTTKTGYQATTTIIYPVGSAENIKSNNESYCIDGYHESTADKPWSYDSAKGGLKEGICS